jgi:hypothetical protein
VSRDKKVLINPTRKADEQIVIKISPAGAPIKESEGPIVIDNLDQSNVEKISKGDDVNNHEARINTSVLENFQPTWCPSGLSRTQNRKLQRARCKKFKEEGLTKMGKQIFNKDSIFPQSSKKEPAACSKSVELTPKSAELTPVSAEPTPPILAALADPKSAKPTFSGTGASGVSPVDLVPTVIDLVPVGVEKLSGGQAIFKKLADHVNHLKSLHVKGYINGKLVNNMLVDSGASVNLMPYSLYKKLGRSDEELIKSKRTVKGIVSRKPISARGLALMKLTIGSKTLATVFLIAAEVQGSYSLILGREWIHGNTCVPSSLHRFLIQWVDDEVEIVHADSSAYAMVDASLLGGHDDMICLSGRNLTGFESIEEALFLFL